MFHVSLLEPYHQRDGVEAPAFSNPELVDGGEEWEVEEIVDHRGTGNKKAFLVKWTGWPAEYNSWVPASDMANATDVRDAYEAQAQPKRRGRPRK